MTDHEANQQPHRQSKALSKMEVLKMAACSLSRIRFAEILRGIEEVYFSNTSMVRRKRAGFINKHGEWVFHSNNVMTSSKFSCGFYCEQRGASALFLNKIGSDAFGKTFRWAEAFSENLACVIEGGKWGFIDTNGEYEIAPTFEDVGSFQNGRAAAKKNGLWGFVDTGGEWVLEPKYECVLSFSEQRAAVSSNQKIAFVDLNGQTVTDFEFDEVGLFADGRAKTVVYETDSERHMVKYIDADSKVVFDLNKICSTLSSQPVNLGYGRNYLRFEQGLDQYLYAGVADGMTSRHTLSSRKQRHGNTIHHSQFSDGLLKIFVEGKCGYLDRSGDVVIPVRFHSASGFREGLARVYIDPTPAPSTDPGARAQWASHAPVFIDQRGEMAFQLEPGDSASSFSDGLAYVRGKSGRRFVNKLGATAFNLRSDIDQIGEFNDGLAPAAISMTTLWVQRD